MLRSNVRVAELDREIAFIQPIIEQGDSGEDKIIGWEEIVPDSMMSAKKIENGGGTSVFSDRITWSQQTTWIIRHRTDLNVKMRLVWDTKVYEVLNIADHEDGRERFLSVVTNLLDNEYFT